MDRQFSRGGGGATSRSIFRRDISDDQVKAFIVRTDTAGFKVEKNPKQDRLKVVSERLDHDGKLPRSRENRLQNDHRSERTAAGAENDGDSCRWEATGCVHGASQSAQYCMIGCSSQADRLIPDGGISACQKVSQHQPARIALGGACPQLEAEGKIRTRMHRFANAFTTPPISRDCRVGRARLGGNCIAAE